MISDSRLDSMIDVRTAGPANLGWLRVMLVAIMLRYFHGVRSKIRCHSSLRLGHRMIPSATSARQYIIAN